MDIIADNIQASKKELKSKTDLMCQNLHYIRWQAYSVHTHTGTILLFKTASNQNFNKYAKID